MPYGLPWSEEFITQLEDKEVRDEFVADQVRLRISLAINALREQEDRNWSQTELGERMNKPQSVVSRLENPDYGKATLQTLLEVAAAFDLPLLVEIPSWDDWARRTANMQMASFYKDSFNADNLKKCASAAKAGIKTGNIASIYMTYSELPQTGSTVGVNGSGSISMSYSVANG